MVKLRSWGEAEICSQLLLGCITEQSSWTPFPG